MEQAAAFGSGSTRATAAWARDALRRLQGRPHVLRAGLALNEGGGRRLLFTASDRANEVAVDWCHVDAYQDVPLNAAVRTGEVVLGSLEELAGRYPDFIARQRPPTASVATAPLRAAGQVLGAFVLFYDAPPACAVPDVAALAALGETLGAELRRAQRATMLPTRSLVEDPVAAGARWAVHDVASVRDIGAARTFLRRLLRDWHLDRETTEDALLCLSELVTNALVHTDRGCQVKVVYDQGVLTTMVRDTGPSVSAPGAGAGLLRRPAEAPFDDPLAVHGRGLALVDALADRWGSELDAGGTTVWFVLDRSA